MVGLLGQRGAGRAHRRALGATLALLLAAPPAGAWQAQAGLQLSGGYSDNIGLAEENAIGEFFGTGEVGIGVTNQSSNLSADVVSILGYRGYFDGEYDNDTLLYLDGNAVWHIAPERLRWTVRDFLTETLIEPRGTATPDNRQSTNLFRTGPELSWRVGGPDELQAGGYYTRLDAEHTDIDYSATTAYARWVRDINRRTSASLNVEHSDYQYRQARLYPDHQQLDFFLGVSRRYPTAVVELEVGHTRLDRERYADPSGGLLRLDWQWQVNSRTGLGARYRHGYSALGEDIYYFAEQVADAGILDEQLTADVFHTREVALELTRSQLPFDVELNGRLQEEDYEVVSLDRQVTTWQVDVGYAFSRSLHSAFMGRVRDAEYKQIDQTDTDRILGLLFDYRIRSRLTAGVRLYNNSRDSSVAGRDYTENRGEVVLTYGYWPDR